MALSAWVVGRTAGALRVPPLHKTSLHGPGVTRAQCLLQVWQQGTVPSGLVRLASIPSHKACSPGLVNRPPPGTALGQCNHPKQGTMSEMGGLGWWDRW